MGSLSIQVDFLGVDNDPQQNLEGIVIKSPGTRFVVNSGLEVEERKTAMTDVLSHNDKFWRAQSSRPTNLTEMLESIGRHLAHQNDNRVFTCATESAVMWVRVIFQQ